MAEGTPNIGIIRTKLHRPPVTRDLVPRMQLLERLEYHRQRPLTLVAAPAGYGKSTLVSHWLEASACPGAWVSLDEDDNDLRLFLTYFLEAIRSVFPAAMQETVALLKAGNLPPVSELAAKRMELLGSLEAAKMQESVNKAMESLSATVADDAVSLDKV